jgi:apolipoprotein N-acyltransferase
VDIMHARAATFRAVENGVALVRPTGNGLSIAVDHLGQALATADYFATDRLTMIVDVPTRGGWTLHTWIGDGLAYASVALLAALSALAFVRRRTAPVLTPEPA